MSKKKKFTKPSKHFGKLKKMLKKADEYVEVTHIIKLDGKISSDVPPRAVCTASNAVEPHWATERDNNMLNLAILAKQHEIENPGHYRRHHANAN